MKMKMMRIFLRVRLYKERVCVRVPMYVCLTASVWLGVELTNCWSRIGVKSGRFVSMHVCIYMHVSEYLSEDKRDCCLYI